MTPKKTGTSSKESVYSIQPFIRGRRRINVSIGNLPSLELPAIRVAALNLLADCLFRQSSRSQGHANVDGGSTHRDQHNLRMDVIGRLCSYRNRSAPTAVGIQVEQS